MNIRPGSLGDVQEHKLFGYEHFVFLSVAPHHPPWWTCSEEPRLSQEYVTRLTTR